MEIGSRDPPPNSIVDLDISNEITKPLSIVQPAATSIVTPSSSATKRNSSSLEEAGFIDSIMGEGTQSRIVGSVNGWLAQKVKSNPGCVERFVCETYKTGETMTGVPYLVMQLTNAAVSFMVADMFEESINMQEITRAARFGRTAGTCVSHKCDLMDGQLRTLGDYLSSLEDFVSSVFSSVSNSINIGKK